MPAKSLDNEDIKLIQGLFEVRDNLKNELSQMPSIAKRIKKEIRSLNDVSIGEKFDISGTTVRNEYNKYLDKTGVL